MKMCFKCHQYGTTNERLFQVNGMQTTPIIEAKFSFLDQKDLQLSETYEKTIFQFAKIVFKRFHDVANLFGPKIQFGHF